jgi:hypothetical protein
MQKVPAVPQQSLRDSDVPTLVSESGIVALSFPTILINHFPLLALPGSVSYYFAINCIVKSIKPVNKGRDIESLHAGLTARRKPKGCCVKSQPRLWCPSFWEFQTNWKFGRHLIPFRFQTSNINPPFPPLIKGVRGIF